MDIDLLQVKLENEVIILDPLEEKHRDALYEAASDPQIWEQHPKHDRWKREVFDDFFDVAMKGGLAFAVIDKSINKIIGSSRYKLHDTSDDAVEIGWTFLCRSHWGGRWNAEMKRLMIEHAHRYFAHVLLCIDADNVRSSKAAQKIGAVLITSQNDELFDKRPNYLTYRISR